MSIWERRYERKAARRYMHMVASERPCWRSLRHRFCLRCAWRLITGQMRHDRAVQLARYRRVSAEARACSHTNREVNPTPYLEWSCRDCATVRPARSAKRDLA